MRLAPPCLALALLVLSCVAGRAQAQEVSRPFSHIQADWNRILESSEQLTEGGPLSPALVERQQRALAALRDEAVQVRQAANDKLALNERLLHALGPAPEAGAPPENADVAQKRAAYNSDIADYRARAAQAELAITRADELTAALAQRSRQALVATLSKHFPLPLAPATVARAVPEMVVLLRDLALAPSKWWHGLSPRARDDFSLTTVILLLAAAAVVGFVIRRLLLGRFGRDPAVAEPSYHRRLTAAIAESVARGVVPALILGSIVARLRSPSAHITGAFADLIISLSIALIVVILAMTLPRAVLAPRLPHWRLAPIAPQQGRAICRYVTLLAVIFAVDHVLTVWSGSEASPALSSLYTFAVNGPAGTVLILLMRGGLWRAAEGAGDGEGAGEAVPPADDTTEGRAPSLLSFWGGIRALIALTSLAGIVASLAGYSRLSFFLIDNLMLSGLIVGALFIVRSLMRELIGLLTSSGLFTRTLLIPRGQRQLIKFWSRAFLDLVVLLAGVALIVPQWGVSTDSMLRSAGDVLRGFQIGNVTISILDIAVALAIFVLALLVTRVLQRALAERMLPQTRLDVGVRNSLTSGFGYLGLVIAAALAVSVVGIDLSNIALIAGALSVGIGFGLQNIVNNFVSGLILLVERPVKVGDWVVIGDKEGFVRRISVRATELQTFQRASVIIPNAELLSGAVTNWTHKDRQGRIEIVVGVAYGSDVEKVREILLECAHADERVLSFPEPFVIFRDFGSSSLDFDLRCYTGDVLSRLRISSDLRFAIDRRFREAGIEIPFPQRVVHFATPPPAAAPPTGPLPSTGGAASELADADGEGSTS